MTVPEWDGRVDGDGPEHLRWHQIVQPYSRSSEPGACAFVGFASEAGVRRNKGRVGAAEGPAALRRALAPMALSVPIDAVDAGTITVTDDLLEDGQRELGETVATLLDAGHFPVVLGGGHEVAYGTFLGLDASAMRAGARVGILNLDAHFDLRGDAVPSSGTPFRQILEGARAAGTQVRYDVVGISQPSNTRALFDTADRLGVRYLLDDDCGVTDFDGVREFVDSFLADVDLVYLTIDLDVLPASVAPGVSAPAAFGVPLATIASVCDQVAASGKLVVFDVAELNPTLDIDARTARTAARLIHPLITRRRPIR
ncbi:formimidoylglutamase [Antrihabitans cavernicola]|uniref:Formimidoylglutamase n=1 Tax=Antrihabitans cavernicola TaxID=2495913 RepID=A0A5A7SAN1_9NOCA|nr:formimidoylglutamase [Spelaeibacter cavernicola]KAA0023210.1 formimidoylglutamase [Spelaeibacter cavernicola]